MVLRRSIELFHELTIGGSSSLDRRISTGVFLPGHQDVSLFVSPDGNYGISVPAREDEFAKVKNDRRGVITLTRANTNGQNEVRVTLTDDAQLELFAYFTDQIVNFLDNQPMSPIAGVKQLLDRWRRLFARTSGGNSLSQNDELGLLCELEVLLELLRRGESVNCWAGPTGTRHDFKTTNFSIECKATSNLNGLRVEIHGAQQLEPLEEIPLLLIVRVYDEHPAGELSVQKTALQILSELSTDADLFLDRLRLIGVEPSILWNTDTEFRSFKPTGAYEFDVVEAFPRISGIDTSSRIQDVRYKLDLSDPASVPGAREFNEFFD